MRKLARLAAAAVGAAALAAMFSSPVAAIASTSAPAAQPAAAITRTAVHYHGQPACEKVQSAGRESLMRCSQLLGVTPAKARPQGTAPPVLARQLSASSSDGCVGNGHGDDECTYTVSPRVTCGGYNGHVWWVDLNFGGTSSIGTYGDVWDTCYADTTYVYLSWQQNMGLRSGNDQAGWASSNTGTRGVNYTDGRPAESVGGVSDVGIVVCNNYNYGWHCGAPQHV